MRAVVDLLTKTPPGPARAALFRAAGLKLEKIAKRAKVSRPLVSLVYANRRTRGAGVWRVMTETARVLGAPVEKLFPDAGPPKRGRPAGS